MHALLPAPRSPLPTPHGVLAHSYLTSGSSLVGLLGRYFFTRLLRVGTKAGRLRTWHSCRLPAESQRGKHPPTLALTGVAWHKPAPPRRVLSRTSRICPTDPVPTACGVPAPQTDPDCRGVIGEGQGHLGRGTEAPATRCTGGWRWGGGGTRHNLVAQRFQQGLAGFPRRRPGVAQREAGSWREPPSPPPGKGLDNRARAPNRTAGSLGVGVASKSVGGG